jgi:hypothetical protein
MEMRSWWLATLTLGACTSVQQAAIKTSVEKRQTYNDGKAQLLLLGPCDMSVGAYWRALTPFQRRAVEALCGGESMPRKSDTVLGKTGR